MKRPKLLPVIRFTLPNTVSAKNGLLNTAAPGRMVRRISGKLTSKGLGRNGLRFPRVPLIPLKVEGKGSMRNLGATVKTTYWIAPDQVRRVIAEETEVYKPAGAKYIKTDREELLSFQQ